MSKARKAKDRRDPNVYPPGWDRQRVEAIAEYYDQRKDQAVLDPHSVAEASIGSVWMEIPEDLVPQIRKLIARRRKSA